MTTITIQIQAISGAGAGKSSVIYLIKKALRESGLNVEFDGGMDFKDENEFDKVISKNLDGALDKIKNRLIVIKEVQANLTS
jgi:hypothetical protein